jgi:hypothetical protein
MALAVAAAGSNPSEIADAIKSLQIGAKVEDMAVS